ncbi:glycerol-3-phosphate 1-O-acyltransferase PlsY [Yunchengibacter salinarum]|uniref:glycerol-3-phosphate 1-O-acyltransferase PlsY n=1 Tax=Yunchengibacter salinarum TaxID=3133399 RepID=UPI0035B595D0
MAEPMTFIPVLLAAYLLGSVPFGLVLTRLAGLGDIRDIGSGNIGATNVLRTGRKDLAAATLLLDIGKGAIAVLATRHLVGGGDLPALAGAAAFLGHCYPVFLAFRGGKGVATFLGTLVAINPALGALTGAVWLVVALLFRMSSLAALMAALAAPVVAHFLYRPNLWLIVGAMTALIYLRHRDNIARIMAGTEPKIGAKDKSTG